MITLTKTLLTPVWDSLWVKFRSEINQNEDGEYYTNAATNVASIVVSSIEERVYEVIDFNVGIESQVDNTWWEVGHFLRDR